MNLRGTILIRISSILFFVFSSIFLFRILPASGDISKQGQALILYCFVITIFLGVAGLILQRKKNMLLTSTALALLFTAVILPQIRVLLGILPVLVWTVLIILFLIGEILNLTQRDGRWSGSAAFASPTVVISSILGGILLIWGASLLIGEIMIVVEGISRIGMPQLLSLINSLLILLTAVVVLSTNRQIVGSVFCLISLAVLLIRYFIFEINEIEALNQLGIKGQMNNKAMLFILASEGIVLLVLGVLFFVRPNIGKVVD